MKREQRTYRNLKPVAEARRIFLSRFANASRRLEVVPVRQALGRYLANAVYAARSVPAYHGAAVDGVAVVAATTFPALPESPVLLAAGSAAIIAAAEGNRSAGSFSNARATTPRYGSGSIDTSGLAVRCFISTSPTLSPSKGTRPVSSS